MWHVQEARHLGFKTANLLAIEELRALQHLVPLLLYFRTNMSQFAGQIYERYGHVLRFFRSVCR